MSDPSSPITTPEQEKVNPSVSPTGTPVVPATWVPWLSIVAALSGAIALGTSVRPLPPVAVGIAGLVNLVSLILLGQSPGLRK